MVSILKWTREQIQFAHDLFKLEDQVANVLSFAVGAIVASGGIVPINLSLVCGFVAVVGALLGTNLINHVADVVIDRINKPHRPIPSGKLKAKTAVILTGVLYFISLFAAAMVSLEMIGLTVIYIFLGAAYSLRPFRFKEKLVLSNLSIAIWYNFVNFLIGWVVFRPVLEAPYALLTLLFLYDMIAINSKDYPDVEGDKKHGAKTLPVILGIDRALRLDLIMHSIIQIAFIILGALGMVEKYISVIAAIMLAVTIYIHYDAHRHKNYMKFYYISFGMHIIIRLLVLILFFSKNFN
jgi:4-hydroxybenzoate polyprenyltransferase